MKKIKTLDLKRETVRSLRVGTGLKTGSPTDANPPTGGINGQTSAGIGTNGLKQVGAADGAAGAGAGSGQSNYTFSPIRH